MKTLSIVGIVEHQSGKYGTFCHISPIEVDKEAFEVEEVIAERISSFLDSPIFMVPSHSKKVVSISHCIY